MDWITFIKWNLLFYCFYYAVNLAYDLLFKRSKPAGTSSVKHYDVQSLQEEQPVKVSPQDVAFPEVDGKKVNQTAVIDQNNAIEKVMTKQLQSDQERNQVQEMDQQQVITFRKPVQDQGIPIQEFLAKAKAASHQINF